MACGSCGAASAARAQAAAVAAGQVFVVRYNDGTRSKPYPDEMSAKVALARSGKAGAVKQETKAA